MSRGQQTFKFGADINHVNDVIDNLRFEGGAYSYNNISDFIVDYTNFATSGAIRAGRRDERCVYRLDPSRRTVLHEQFQSGLRPDRLGVLNQ